MTTQNEALLQHLKTHKKGITTYVAFDVLGITCVHKRIAELEAKNHKIERQFINGTNRYGNPCRVVRYRLV